MDWNFDVQTQGFSTLDTFMPEFEDLDRVWESLDMGGKDGEFTKANSGKKKVSESKNVAALKSHCEAERRRRERINGHLANLRDFVPCTDKVKVHKVNLGEVEGIKCGELANASSPLWVLLEATKGLVIPTDADEVTVETYNNEYYDTPRDEVDACFTFKASVSFRYKPELMPELRQAIDRLKLTISKAEISTLGGRLKTVFIVTGRKDEIGYQRREKFAKCVRKALSSVLEKITALEEYSPKTMFPYKKRRVYFTESSTLSPLF